MSGTTRKRKCHKRDETTEPLEAETGVMSVHKRALEVTRREGAEVFCIGPFRALHLHAASNKRSASARTVAICSEAWKRYPQCAAIEAGVELWTRTNLQWQSWLAVRG